MQLDAKLSVEDLEECLESGIRASKKIYDVMQNKTKEYMEKLVFTMESQR